MKTAVLITGHMRTFSACIKTLKWHVVRHYENPSFYVSTVNDEQAESWKLLETEFPGAPIYVEVVDKQPDIPEPAEPIRFEPYARSVPMQAVLRQLWQLNECWRLYMRSGDFGHEVFIRTRPDNFFQSFEKVSTQYETAWTPWWGRFGGVNDRFAVMDNNAAKAYHTTFEAMPQLLAAGAPIHPESLVMGALQLAGCAVYPCLKTQFCTLRMNGELRMPEITPWDMAEAAIV